MARSMMNVKDVAASLHVSTREVERMAEQRILPAVRVRGAWRFRPGEVWNWIDDNLHALPDHRKKDRHPAVSADMLIASALPESAVGVDVRAKTRSSVLRELVHMAERAHPSLDGPALITALREREDHCSTALEHGVAVPHPARPFYSDGPILAAARTAQGIVFGERRGGLTDLFFLVCCPNHADHLLYLGRLCRLLVDGKLRTTLRAAQDAREWVEALRSAESMLCHTD